MPAGTELTTRGAEAAALPIGFEPGVSGVLKGCATPGLEVAAGAPVAARGVAVVAVSAVMGVEARDCVVVKVRAKVEGARRERRVRQRLQIMVAVLYGTVCWPGVFWWNWPCFLDMGLALKLEVRVPMR